MRRSVRTLAPLLFLLGACAAPDVVIVGDRALSGHLKVKTFRVAPGATVTAPADLVVESAGPAIVEGRIRGEVASGASIDIRVSSGDLVVGGGLEAGSGADGRDPGRDGAAGGSVRLRADRGAVLVRGALAAGAGGAGAGRREQGRGELRVVSGAGGAGGDVTIAGASVALDTGAAAGDGGNGGPAVARVLDLAPGAPNLVDSGSDAPEERASPSDERLPAGGAASADSGAGGKGGSISILAPASFRGPAAFVRAGSGGATAPAAARGGASASALLEKPGAGGDVSLPFGALSVEATGWTLVPGNGGDAGRAAEITAQASAHAAAEAATRGGGEAGRVLLGTSTARWGAGGDGGGVLAQSDRKARYALGEAARGPAPGKAAAARAP